MAEILLADDDASIRVVLTQALTRAGHEVRSTSNAATLWKWVQAGEGDAVVSDVMMPDETAFDVLPRMRNARPELPVILMSAQNTFMTAIRASEQGAYEYLPKPFDLPELLAVVERAVERKQKPRVPRGAPEEQMPLVGRSSAMQEVYRVLARVMQTELTVMITGESGTGKELAARALHDYGRRRQGPFVAVSTAAVPDEMMAIELFGCEAGADPGSAARRVGKFEHAQGGTILLDEIGDMAPEAQTRLLRVLQHGEYTPVGGNIPVRTDVRVLAATNRDLPQLIARGRFREDLFYRLNVVPLRLPPLRERARDIPDLVRHFFTQGAVQGLSVKSVEPLAMERLQAHDWPGNVRELENLVRRMSALCPGEAVTADFVHGELASSVDAGGDAPVARTNPADIAMTLSDWTSSLFADSEAPPRPGLYHRVLEEVERPLIRAALAATRGNQIRAAEILGVNRNTLRKKIRDLDVEVTRYGR